MLRIRARLLTATFAAALLAVLSVVSAYQMAPDHDRMQKLAVVQVLGASLDDFCGTASGDHEHQCPFCHKLPEPPAIAASTLARRVVHVIGAATGGDLVVGPQHIRPDVSSRAPPSTV